MYQWRECESQGQKRTWSTVARVQSGLRTFRLAFRSPSNACCTVSMPRFCSMVNNGYSREKSLHARDACLGIQSALTYNEPKAETYQYTIESFHPLSPRQYGPGRLCRTGSVVVSPQTAWWRWHKGSQLKELQGGYEMYKGKESREVNREASRLHLKHCLLQ